MTSALVMDTTGPVLGVAVYRDGTLLRKAERLPRGGERVLMPWAVELLAGQPVDVVGVAVGPGAFTGLRVGLASALGYAVAARVQVVPVGSLQSRLAQISDDTRPAVAMLDARKSRVYGRWRGQEAADVAPEVLLQDAPAGFVAVGEGAVVYADLVQQAGGTVHPDAAAVGLIGLVELTLEGFKAGLAVDPSQVRPVYLRAPDAKPRKPKRPGLH